MKRERDKYGRGSAAANGAGFVDLEPGDTFAGLEQKLRARISEMKDAGPERTPRGAMPEGLNAAPFQNLTPFTTDKIAYYVGDVNWTRPEFLNRSEMFSVERAAALLEEMVSR